VLLCPFCFAWRAVVRVYARCSFAFVLVCISHYALKILQHLGESQVEQTPHRRGFDFSLGYFGGQEDYYTHDVGASWPDGNTSTAPLPGNMSKSCQPNGACSCRIVDLWQSDPTSNTPAPLSLTGEYSMFFYARRAVQIIEAQAADAAVSTSAGGNNSRMFMYEISVYAILSARTSIRYTIQSALQTGVSHTGVLVPIVPVLNPHTVRIERIRYFASQLIHDPHQVPQRFIDLYPPTTGGCPAAAMMAGGCDCCGRRVVLAMMSCLDEVVLNLTNALERTGLMSNTLFVFASDNGGVVADHGANVPLRGG
jgi:hypothetical protein